MPFDKHKYGEYEKELYSLTDTAALTEDRVNALFAKLLEVLPNSGKLYKYKALNTFHIDELEDGYIWFCSAKKLNDNKDCTFNANFLEETERLVKFFLTDDNFRKMLVQGLYMNLSRHSNITPKAVEDCLNCLSQNRLKIAKYKFDKFCKDYRLSTAQQQQLINTIAFYSDPNETVIRKSVSDLFEQIKKIRTGNQVCSLTTSYDKDSMWAYYCNNHGICIEYDFSKISTYVQKGVFINTQKVRYSRKKKFSYCAIIQAKILNTPEAIAEADKIIVEQLLTKDKSWQTEDEWRVLTYDRGNENGLKVPTNIVSAIYIDYPVLKKEKAKRIIAIANKNNWNVYVRYFDEIKAEYRYDTIANIRAYTKKLKQVNMISGND